MVGMISTVFSSNANSIQTVASSQPITQVQAEKTAATDIPSDTISSVSALARQLSDAAKRAEARDAALSHKELGEKAESLLSEITGTKYHQRQDAHHAEIPDTNDEQLLARARQATGYLKGTDSNPFKGLSRDQLALITYDEGGDFTVDERRAAWSQRCQQEQLWRQNVIQAGTAESEATGKETHFYEELLEHYNGLPAIERAQYPISYAMELQMQIDQGSSDQAPKPGAGPLTLFQMLAKWQSDTPHDPVDKLEPPTEQVPSPGIES